MPIHSERHYENIKRDYYLKVIDNMRSYIAFPLFFVLSKQLIKGHFCMYLE